MSSELQQQAATVLIGTSLAYYLYLSLSQTAHEVTPRKFSTNNDAVLSLVNFDDADADQLALVLPSWTGVIQAAEIAEVTIFPDDAVTSDLLQMKSDARQAYHTIDAQNKKISFQQDTSSSSSLPSYARPATLSMKTVVEIAGNQDLDVLLSPIEVASKAKGQAMEITCIIALCTGPNDGDVDIFQKTVHGRVTSDVKYLEKLAAARRRGHQHRSSSSSTSAFSASNFLTLEDLFVPEEGENPASLLDDRQSQWIKLFASLSSSSSSSSFADKWKQAKIYEAEQKMNNSSNNNAMSSLLVAPWKYRAFIDLAHFLMYGQNERRFGSVFSGFGRGLAFGARSIKSLFGFSGTGSVSEGMKKISRGVSSVVSGSGDNKDGGTSSESNPPEGSFSTLCNYDFGYNPEHPLSGRFEVHITVKIQNGEKDVEKFKNFADKIGLKIVQIELPAGQYPTQLMTSFYMQGLVDRCTSGAFDLALQLFILTGLEVLRVKLELQVHDIRAALKLHQFQKTSGSSSPSSSSNPESPSASPSSPLQLLRPFLLVDGPGIGLCPVRDFEARDRLYMTPTQYFEFHLKLKIQEDVRDGVLQKVKEVCNQHDAHLSKNAFKPSSASNDNNNNNNKHTYFYFVTLRLYEVGLVTSLEKLDKLKQALEDCLGQKQGDDENAKASVHSIQREFAVFDSSAKLDRGWIDARTTSNVHNQSW